MIRKTIGLGCWLGVLAGMSLPLAAAPILTAISGDTNGIPRRVQGIDAGASTATTVGDLGDGLVGFTGGLAYNGSLFYAIGNDSFGNSSLYSFTTPGSLSSLFALGTGFSGGLAFTGSNLYAISNDLAGNSTLNSIDVGGGATTALFALGTGFNGGLTYHSGDGLLYGIANDLGGNSTLYRINTGTQAVTAQSIALGQGFYGGLAYDTASGRFYAVGSDAFANSTLYSFALNDTSPTALFSTGQGFLFAGLTAGSAGGPSPVPEPSTAVMMLGGLIVAGLGAARRRRAMAQISAVAILAAGLSQPAAASPYVLDDGTSDLAIAPSTQNIWVTFGNRFTAPAGGDTISSISIAWGTPSYLGSSLQIPNGTPVTVKLWSNPDGFSLPDDAILLASVAGVVSNSGTDTFVHYDLPDTVLTPGQSFFVGASIFAPDTLGSHGWIVAALDQNTSGSTRSYITNHPDFAGAASFSNTTGVFMVRANVADGPSPVPEPSSAWMLLGGLVVTGLGANRFRR